MDTCFVQPACVCLDWNTISSILGKWGFTAKLPSTSELVVTASLGDKSLYFVASNDGESLTMRSKLRKLGVSVSGTFCEGSVNNVAFT